MQQDSNDGPVQIVLTRPRTDGMWTPPLWLMELMAALTDLQRRVEALEGEAERGKAGK